MLKATPQTKFNLILDLETFMEDAVEDYILKIFNEIFK